MAEDCVNQAAVLAKLEDRPCVTRQLKVHGFHRKPEEFGDLHFYGDDAPAIADLIASDPNHGQLLHDGLPHRAGQVVWAARFEMARTVDDFLSRRTRATVLNVRAAVTMAPAVARILAQELGRSSDWVSDQVAQYESIASGYMIDRP
jgi:glycerol-3-phosphate dehydrogenase